MAESKDIVLPLVILKMSSSDQQCQSESILHGDPQAAGWISAANSDLPQYLILKLADGLCEISSIQFVAHEIFVPQTVSVFTSLDDPVQEWVAIGTVKMGTAAQQKARERKTIKLKYKCRLIKFSFPEVLQIQDNPYNQVSIVSVLVKGVKQSEQTPGRIMSASNRAFIPDAMAKKAVRLQQFLDKGDSMIEEIRRQQEKAVEEDEYNQADKLETAVNKIQQLQSTLQQLEMKKMAAIQAHNFKAANELKQSTQKIEALFEMDLEALIKVLNGEKVSKPPVFQPQIQPQQPDVQQQPPPQAAAPNRPASAKAVSFAAKSSEDRPLGVQQAAQNPSEDRPLGVQQGAVPVNPFNDPSIDPSQLRGRDFFKLSDEENAKLQAENQRRIQAAMNSYAQEQDEKDAASQNAPKKKVEVDAATAVTEDEAAVMVGKQTKFLPGVKYDILELSERLATEWDKEESPPPKLNSQVKQSADVTTIIQAGINEMVPRLALGRSVDHVKDSLRFIDMAMRSEPDKYLDAAIAVIALVDSNPNFAMFQFVRWIFPRVYVLLLKKYSQFDGIFDIEPQQMHQEAAIAAQTDNAIITNRMNVKFLKNQRVDDVEEYLFKTLNTSEFNKTVMKVAKMMIARLHNSARFAKTFAINMLVSMLNYPCFPIKSFVNFYLNKSNINDFAGMYKEDNLKNSKFQYIIEVRIIALAALVDECDYIVSKETLKTITEFLIWEMPVAQKIEFRNGNMRIIQKIYQNEELGGVSEALRILNLVGKLPSQMKQFEKDLLDADKEIQREKCVKYAQNDAKDVGKLIQISGKSNNQQKLVSLDFLPNVCQFCLYELSCQTKDIPERMWNHLIKDCPCCCCCPSCHQVVENVYLPAHLAYECTEPFKYKVVLCEKCHQLVDEQELNDHMAQCQVHLQEGEIPCPFCGLAMTDAEQILSHYSDKSCQANVRTTDNLIKIVQEKLRKNVPE